MRIFDFSPTSVSLSPNVQKDDVFLSWKIFFSPWLWKTGEKIREFEEDFKNYLGVKNTISFNSGRSAMMAILYALGIKSGDEVLVQAFTCNAALNPILWCGAKPVFADIIGENDLNVDPDDLESKITAKSRAIIIQHTFGCPAKMDKIMEIAKLHGLKVIEDCAHSLGAKVNGKKVGCIGDVSFFSFGRDKVISSVYGGMAVTENDEIAKKIEEFRNDCKFPSNFWIFQQIFHPIIFSIALSVYYFFGAGKFLIWFFQRIGFLSKAVTIKEKNGENPGYFPQKMPNALAFLASRQLNKTDEFNRHRGKIAEFYDKKLKGNSGKRDGSIFLRYPIFVKDQKKAIIKARKKHILLNDGWLGNAVVPPGTNIKKMGYITGNCPKAESISKKILNLPTHINISIEKAEKIIKCIQSEK